MNLRRLTLPLLAIALSAGTSFMSFDAAAQYPGFNAPEVRVSGNAAAGLVPVSPRVDGGSIPVGAAAQVVVLFRNDGTQPVSTGRIDLYPSSNVSAAVSLDQCAGEALPAGAECALAMSVKALQAGPWRVEMLMTHSGRSRLVTTTLSGSVDSGSGLAESMASDLETMPREVDFGALAAGQVLVEPIILRNITSKTLTIADMSIRSSDSAGYTLESACEILNAGQSCVATVKWAPQKKGPATGVLVIDHDGPTGMSSVILTGDYAPDDVDQAEIFPEAVPGKGLLVSSQTEIDFGDAVSSTSTITVSLVNTGDAPLTLDDIKISGSNNGLSLNEAGCSAGLELQPIEACPLTINWSPARVGTVLDDVQISHSGARGILVLPVRGEAREAVSQDQKAIVLRDAPTHVINNDDVTSSRSQNARQVTNAASALDGLRITSFSANRAIVSGPGGSRLVFDAEPIMLGGVMWDVALQPNGIEFENGDDRILLLFDRSLSSVNRNAAQSIRTSASVPSGDGDL